MNQILLTGDPKKNNKEKNKDDGIIEKKPISLDKIKVFFGIVLIVFGISLVGIFGYKAINKKTDTDNKQTPVVPEQVGPLELSLDRIDLTDPENIEDKQVQKVAIMASSGAGIDEIIYSWNDEEMIVTKYNGDPSIKLELDVPAGDNSLYVKALDLNGEESETTTDFSIINTELQPEIELFSVDDKLKIVATSDIPLKNLKYCWENDDEVIIEPETDEDTRIEVTIDVKVEKNELKIIATDCNGNNKIKTKDIIGQPMPEISVVKKGDKVHMKVSHYKGIKSIVFEINGTKYTYDENSKAYDESKKEIEYYYTLKEGENKVYITATSVDDVVAKVRKKCTYEP